MFFYILLFIADLCVLYFGFLSAVYLRFLSIPVTIEFLSRHFLLFSSLVLVYLICFVLKGGYPRRFRSRWELLKTLFWALLFGMICGMSFAYIFRFEWGSFPSSIFVISFPVILFFLFCVNTVIYSYSDKLKRNVLFIGEAELAEPQEFLNTDIDDIVITTNKINSEQIYLLLDIANRMNIKLSVLPDLYDRIFSRKVNEGDEFLYLLPAYFYARTDEHLLRIVDIVIATTLLLFFLPIMFLIVLLIKIDSSGPVIYKQPRVGLNGKIFNLYKFRSMFVNSEQRSRSTEVDLNEDARVTGIGRILRRTRLDELPQIINVLCAHMSMVGPRPEALYRVREHRALQGIRLCVRPGLTGLAQVEGSYHIKPGNKLRYDYLYIRNRSLLLNLNILARTVLVILFKKGS
ncbi:MAG: sugar transferase [Candidatus Omnitrophota bacterium]|jgi:lipopolysaccharide/colanic/teichoic acid biosynthesis glycosyltransferase